MKAADAQHHLHGPTAYPTEEFIRNESVFLVMGKAVPEGPTVYVLLRDQNRQQQQAAKEFAPIHYLVINPCTGAVFSAMDPNCPLREIETLATPYNVWANIQVGSCEPIPIPIHRTVFVYLCIYSCLQPSLLPSSIDYNVLNAELWRPFFCGRFPMPKVAAFASCLA